MRTTTLQIACALAALTLPAVAAAQDETATEEAHDEARQGRQHAELVPYIEAAQVFSAELEPGDDTVTYTAVAAGVDASIAGRNSAASVSLRYERRIGYDDNSVDGDTISGVARAGVMIAKGLTLEAGGLAAQTRVDGNGAASIGGFAGNDDATSQVYAAYAGPSVHTMAGDVEIEGHYRFGYTRVEEPDALVLAPGAQPVDVFDDSTTHAAVVRAGVRPDVVAPIGVGVGGGWIEQNISNLDQRVRDRHVRADATLPLSPNFAVVGGVGYEDVEVSSRDARRDALGNPVVGTDGRFVTDDSAPRQIAYQTDGLIWDAGVLWRPSRRTSLEAHVGRRYGSMTYFGSFSYAPDSRTSMAVGVYDNVTSFGGVLVDQVAALPAQFDAFRNPISGQLGGCVASAQGGGCFAGALGTVNAAVFRSRGIAGSYTYDMGRTQLGVGAGYDRRQFIGAAGTVLATIDGSVDETLWYALFASTQLDARSVLSADANMSWFQSEADPTGWVLGYSASLSYRRNLVRGLSGTAAVGLDGINRENLDDFMSASALLGLRYSFN
jgi:hypothetical protein